MLSFFPNYFTNRMIVLYVMTLIVSLLLFSTFTMMWYNYAIVVIGVAGFCYFSGFLSLKWQFLTEKQFIIRLLLTAFMIRVVWVIFSYYFYIAMTGIPFEFGSADSQVYHMLAYTLRHGLVATGEYVPLFLPPRNIPLPFSDSGYAHYLGTVYWILQSDDVFIPRILKAVWGAWTCYLIYRLAARNFGEEAGRIAGILCMLMPHMIYYTGLHVKETEMLFLLVAFMERADYVIRSKKFSAINIALPILLAVLLFSFRTVLGAITLFSFMTALVFMPGRVLSGWKRVFIIAWIVGAGAMLVGGPIMQEVEETLEQREENRAVFEREGGVANQYVSVVAQSYKIAFLPAAVIIPIPTVVYTEGQDNLRMLHSGLFVRGAMSFFLFFAVLLMIRRKEWRNHVLILCFYASYLGVISMSSMFFQERFHLMLTPFLLAFGAYGISQATNRTKFYFNAYVVIYFGIVLVWQYLKITGRGG